jgi:hypothetical protein
MRPWQILWKAEALLLAMRVGCNAPAPAVRMESGAGGKASVHIPRTTTAEPVELTQQEVTQTIRKLAREVRLSGPPGETVEKLFQLDALSVDYLYLLRERRLVPLDSGTPLEGALTDEEQNLVSRYKSYCRSAHGFEGDCLGGALVGGKYMDMQGRYMLAMALSKSLVLEEFEKALGERVSMRAVMQAAMATVVTLLVLLAMPEPVTKFIAAWATVGLILWVGAKTLYNLIGGWFQLMEEVKGSTNFEQIREAGEKFGKLFSREAAQAFAMVAMALLTHTAKGFADQLGTLPGSAQVSMRAAGREGILLSEVSAAESVTVTAEGFSVALAPGVVVMAARGARADRTEKHHLGTISNKKSTLRGGPWTPRFDDIVYRRLEEALGDCRSIAQCRARLLPTLEDLARDIATPGTDLNRLVTLGK